jgi:hypothetical protein
MCDGDGVPGTAASILSPPSPPQTVTFGERRDASQTKTRKHRRRWLPHRIKIRDQMGTSRERGGKNGVLSAVVNRGPFII